MKRCPSCEATKPLTEFGANRARRDGLNAYCRGCFREKQRATMRRVIARDPQAWAAKMAAKRADPAYRQAERERERAANNSDRYRERKRLYMKENWRKYRKPETAAAVKARYRARLLHATPTWADHKAIVSFYAEARRVSLQTGVKHHVDHIVPLQGRNVCGLHVPWNLQVLTGSANQSKGNRLVACNGG